MTYPLDHRDHAATDFDRGDDIRAIALRYGAAETTIRNWLKEAGRDPGRERKLARVRADHFAPEPATPLAKRVRRAVEAAPGAGPRAWAQASGASEGYVSRLVGHWRALGVVNG